MKNLTLFIFTITLILNTQISYSIEKNFKVGMVTDVGGVNDQSFNQSAWEGLQKAKKDLGIKVSYQESKQDADYLSNLETLLDGGNDLIWGIGFKMADVILKAAKENPKQKYALIDYSFGTKNPPNLIGILFKSEEGAFLAGFVASKMSKTKKLGFIGGMSVPAIHSFQYGFKAGAIYADKNTQIIEQYAESFTDAAKGKAMANQLIGKNVDVLFHAAGGVGDGVIEAAKEKNKMVVGVDRDQFNMAPKNVITSSMKRVDNAIFKITEDLKNGIYKGGSTIIFGLKENAVDISPSTIKTIPKELYEEVKKLKEKIIQGKISVPNSEKMFLLFKNKSK